MRTTLTKLWIESNFYETDRAIRADLSNDRHYRVVIRQPEDYIKVAQALFELADMINSDSELKQKEGK